MPAGTTLYRSHGAKLGPWWFGSSLDNRFDLPGPEGTCYTAESELVTLQESWGGIQLIPSTDIAKREISAIAIKRNLLIADATSNLAIQFGVTSELFDTSDYALTQRWASALQAAGFDGIRHWARHDLAHINACVAVFAPGGDQTNTADNPTDFAVSDTENLLGRPDLWEALQAQTGIEVLDIPGSI
jgi:hypothetical protein